MKQVAWITLLAVAGSTAFAEKRIEQGTIRDLQATNFAVAKKKHQQFDFSIDTAGRNYACRTPENKQINATDFVVGSPIMFSSNGRNGEVKTNQGKSAKCIITRVADIGPR